MSSSEQLKPSKSGEIQKGLVPVNIRILDRNSTIIRTIWVHGTYTPEGRFVDYGALTDPRNYDPARDRLVWQKTREPLEPSRRGRPPKQNPTNDAG